LHCLTLKTNALRSFRTLLLTSTVNVKQHSRRPETSNTIAVGTSNSHDIKRV
jgi:hypothetical protein